MDDLLAEINEELPSEEEDEDIDPTLTNVQRRVMIGSGETRNLIWGAVGHIWLERPIKFKFRELRAKTQFCLHNSLDLGLQMPHCIPSCYATDDQSLIVTLCFTDLGKLNLLVVVQN